MTLDLDEPRKLVAITWIPGKTIMERGYDMSPRTLGPSVTANIWLLSSVYIHTHTYIYIYMVKDLDFSNFALKLLPYYHLGVSSILRTPQFDIQEYHMFVQPSSKTVQLKDLTQNWDQVEEISESCRARRTCSS